VSADLWIVIVIVALVLGGSVVPWAVHRHRARVEGIPANSELLHRDPPSGLPSPTADLPKPGGIGSRQFGGPLGL
jgi:hypothetical protein